MVEWGRRVYGVAAIWLGVVGLAWQDFASVWQPVPADAPGRNVLAVFAALLLLLGGIGVQVGRGAGRSGIVLASIYAVFALLWGWRVVNFPQIFATWSGCAEQLALVIAGVVLAVQVHAPDRRRAGLLVGLRIAFGACVLAFGLAHFLYPVETAAMVPGWLPPNTRFWAFATGAAHVAAGAALVSGFLATLAARLLTAMFMVFGGLVWLPTLAAAVRDHMAWGGNGINLALIGAAWIIADALTAIGRKPGHPVTGEIAGS